MLHDPSHYEPPPIAEEIKLGSEDTDILRRLAAELAEIAALPVHREKARLWQKLNDLRVGAADGLDQRDLLARDERRRRVDACDRASLGAGPGAGAAAHALPVAAPAGRHDRQRLPGLPAGRPQHRLRHHRGRGRRQDRRGQRHRLAALQHPDPRFRRPGEDQDAGGHAQRGGHRVPLPGDVRGVRRHHAGAEGRPDAHLVHALGLPDPLVGHRGGDARPDRAARTWSTPPSSGWSTPGWSNWTSSWRRTCSSLDCNNTRIGSGGYGYTSAPAGRRTSIPATCSRTTCGAAPTPRSSPRSRRRCTGSSP